MAVTLRFLATGKSFHLLEYSFRISRQCISKIIYETCATLFKTLTPEYLKTPSSHEEWEDIARGFYTRWNFPNGVGAIDGKRILIKGNNSIVLLATIGPDYKFTWASVPNADMRKALSSVSNPLNLPPPKALPSRSMAVPHLLTGDDAFTLTSYMMKSGLSNEQRIFNYQLSRMRCISENGFGLLANRWRLFRNAIQLPPEK